eukprot:TRINITY_DN83416_c0_g1_i1.p1 TRINITY_DN83416_c0_g1~~TRINITY_DN83416_c0_g1_i1.p1  ORF type:complete len:289 (-),score=84.79 TRINITY_DN83416_c0_g1_i1:32-898(-)
MAEAKQKLQEALAAIETAKQSTPGAFEDAAGEALQACRRAFVQVARAMPELLDELQPPKDMVQTLNFLLQTCATRSVRKSQVKECLKMLFDRPTSRWLFAAASDEKLKESLIAFMGAFRDLAEFKAALEEGVPEPAAATKYVKKPTGASAAVEMMEGEEREEMRRLLKEGLASFRDCNFEYPRGLHSWEDRVLEAFVRKFYKAVAMLATATGREGSKLGVHEGMVGKELLDNEIPLILNFLVEFWEARSTYRDQIKYTVEKLQLLSPPFKAAILFRSGNGQDGLPWLA